MAVLGGSGRTNWKRGLDLLALLGIIQGLWGIDIAVFAPQLLFEWVHWGTYLGLMYLQIGAAGVWLYWRAKHVHMDTDNRG